MYIFTNKEFLSLSQEGRILITNKIKILSSIPQMPSVLVQRRNDKCYELNLLDKNSKQVTVRTIPDTPKAGMNDLKAKS